MKNWQLLVLVIIALIGGLALAENTSLIIALPVLIFAGWLIGKLAW